MSAPDELRRALREPHDEPRAHRNWEAIERRRHRTPGVPSGRGWWLGALGVGAAVALAIVISIGTRRAPGALLAEDGHPAHGMLESDRVRLDDGSEITLEAGARLEVLENAGDHVRFWLHEGVARFDVVPGGPRRWAIETGLVTVEVLGTAFRVARDERSATVSVERGSVLVRGPTAPDGMRRLSAGESLTVDVAEPATPPAPPSEPAISASASTLDPSRSAAHERPPAVDPVAAVPAPRDDVAEPEAPIAPRLRDVDALRAEGRLDEAVALLDTIANDPSAGSERALAAFTRGRIELDRLDRPRDAADAFARSISLGLRAPLLEDARARRVEALARASDLDGARVAADVYRSHHPNGRWLAEVERWSAGP